MAVDARALNGALRPYLGSLGLSPAALAPAIFGGGVAGLHIIVASLSYPSLIFTGELQVYQATGISMALLGSLILAAVVALTSSFPGTVAGAQSEPAVLLGVMAGTVVAGIGGAGGAAVAAGRAEVVLPTTVILIVLSSAVLGVAFLLLGAFRLANLVRYVPYPVIGGFLAGIGWLVFGGGVAALTGTPLRAANVAALAEADALLRWAPGVALAAVLFALQRRRPHVLNLPGMVLAATALFWTAAWLAGESVAGLQGGGWLLGPFPGGSLWAPLPHAAALADADWAIVLGLLPEIGILVLIGLIRLLLTASGLELLVREDVDLNRERCAAGAGNVLSGLAGGLPGYHSLAASSLAGGAGARVRLGGVLVALLCALKLSFGAAVLPYVPKLIAGMLLLYIGLGFLVDALFSSWFRLPRAEYGVLVVVFLSIVLVGILEGIAIGIIAGVVLFVVSYSRINVVRQALTGAQIRSNVERSEGLRDLLRDRGEEIHVLRLQGYIFFGTSNRLLTGIRARLSDAAPPLRFLVLDFRRVSGLDSSALISFTKLTQYAEQHDFELIVTDPSPEVAHALRTAGIGGGAAQPRVRVFVDLDHGLEYCEERILARVQPGLANPVDPLEDQLRRAFPDGAGVERLVGYLEKQTWREGERLIHQGDAAKDLFFVETGRVSVQLELAPGHTLRLRTIGPGTVVGELALYLGLPRSASVVADTETTTYRLTADRLEAIQRADPHAAALFHEFMARMLAGRVVDINRLLEAYGD